MSQSYNFFFEKPHNPPDIFSNPNPKEFISICINSIAKVKSVFTLAAELSLAGFVGVSPAQQTGEARSPPCQSDQCINLSIRMALSTLNIQLSTNIAGSD